MPYVKVKKVWKKDHYNKKKKKGADEDTNKDSKAKKTEKGLTGEEIETLWNYFEDSLPENIKQELEDIPYLEVIRRSNKVHPETDICDGTAGVTPKQMRFLIDSIGFENIKKLFDLMNSNTTAYRTKLNGMALDYEVYERDIILWKIILNEEIIPKIEKSKKEISLGEIFFRHDLGNAISKYQFKDEVYEAYYSNKLDREEVLEMLKQNLVSNSSPLSLKEIKMDNFWDSRKELWKEVQHFIPGVKLMLLLDPEYWDKKIFLDALGYFYGVKQLSKLSSVDQEKFITFYKIFGHNLSVIKNVIKERNMLNNASLNQLKQYPELYTFNEGILNAFIKVTDLAKKGFYFEFDLDEYITILATISLEQGLSEHILKKENLTYSEFKDFILEQKSTVLNYGRTGKIKDLASYDFRSSALFKMYNVDSNEQMNVRNLYAKTSAIKTVLPLFKKTIGNLTVELVDKSDLRGLIAGKATNCCQRAIRAERGPSYGGNASVYYGAEEETSSFLLISKKNRIIAQSWVWLHKDILCYDSLEVLGNEVSDQVLKCYEAYAEHAMEQIKGLKRVTAGSGHGINISRYPVDKDHVTHTYSYDSRGTQYIICDKKGIQKK